LFLGTVKTARGGNVLGAQNLVGESGQLRAAIYCRVSTNDQSCDRQARELQEYADRARYIVSGILLESASGAKDDREQRKKIIDLAKKRLIDVVLVSELTRWGRSTIDLITTLNELQSYGVSLVAQNGFDFNMATPQGKMLAGVMSSLAEFEKDLLRERVKSGIANARARGKVFGRPKGGKTEENCKKIKEMQANGRSVRQVASEIGLSKSAVHKCWDRESDLPEGMQF
jgi:putative DNA-invertase from lambdoid prophage Rac